MATPITGSAADRLAWCANLRLWFFRERHAQCSQLTGDASTSWACCSPRHKAQAAWVSAPAILLPQVHNLAGGLSISMERDGTSFVFFLAPVKSEAASMEHCFFPSSMACAEVVGVAVSKCFFQNSRPPCWLADKRLLTEILNNC